MEYGNGIFLRIYPEYADRILSGEKTIEIRKKINPQVDDGVKMWLCAGAAGGHNKIVGSVGVSYVHAQNKVSLIWKAYGSRTGVSKEKFDKYFEGFDNGYAIQLENPRKLREPLPVYTRNGRSDVFDRSLRNIISPLRGMPVTFERIPLSLEQFLAGDDLYEEADHVS